MMEETDHQLHIKKSVILDGGYSIKMSNRFTIGIPDLLIALPPFAPCLAEVKDLGECVDDFNRQIDVTPKQRSNLNRITDCYKGAHPVSLILVHILWKKEHRLVGLPKDWQRLSADLVPGRSVLRKEGGYYDVGTLLGQLNIAVLETVFG